MLTKHVRTAMLLFALVFLAASISITKKTPESIAKSLKKFDKSGDGRLSKSEFKEFFDKQYMAEFEGIDIDPKFISSTYNHILSCDKDSNGLDLDEMVDALVPKPDQFAKREPGHYDEQDL